MTKRLRRAWLPLLTSLFSFALFPHCQNRSSGPYDLIGAVYEGARSSNGAIGVFTVNSGGSLSAATVPTISAGTRVAHAASTLDGRFFYVVSFDSNDIMQFSLSNKTATSLSPASVATGDGPLRLCVHPNGTYLYVVNNSANTVGQYAIASNGTLSALSTPTVAVAGPVSIAVTGDGQYVYVGGLSGIFQFTVGGGGLLTEQTAPASVPVPGSVTSILVSPNYKNAYALATGSGNLVYQYNIADNGKLTVMTVNSVSTSGTSASALDISPDGKYLYAANSGSNNVAQFTVSTATATPGALTAMSPTTVTTETGPQGIVVSEDSRYLYVSSSSGNISQYSIGLDGTLTAQSTPTVAAPDTNPGPLFRFISL